MHCIPAFKLRHVALEVCHVRSPFSLCACVKIKENCLRYHLCVQAISDASPERRRLRVHHSNDGGGGDSNGDDKQERSIDARHHMHTNNRQKEMVLFPLVDSLALSRSYILKLVVLCCALLHCCQTAADEHIYIRFLFVLFYARSAH